MTGLINKTLVLIPSYNDGINLLRTIASLAEQQVDVLVVDDGSMVAPSLSELEFLFTGEGTIFLLVIRKNGGITKALNIGINWANQRSYEYIGRLDAGDLVVGNRFSVQQKYLEDFSNVGIVGSWVDFVDEGYKLLFKLKHPIDNRELKKAIFRYNPFVHPATLIRLESINKVGGYPDKYPALEDWGIFMAISQFYDLHNIPEVFLKYVVSGDSISSKKRFSQSKSKVRLLLDNYKLNFNQTFGIIRNMLVLLFPREFLTHIKKLFW